MPLNEDDYIYSLLYVCDCQDVLNRDYPVRVVNTEGKLKFSCIIEYRYYKSNVVGIQIKTINHCNCGRRSKINK